MVVNYGSHALVRDNLRIDAADSALAVIVVDNFSSDSERSAIEELSTERGWTFIGRSGNDGFGAGVNAGAARARELGCSSLVLLNPDAQARPEVLTALAQRVRTAPDELVCPRIEDSSGQVVFDGVEVDVRTGRTRRTGATPAGRPSWPWLTGACLAVNVATFEQLGGFDDDYFLYWEDVDLSHRAALAGCRLVVDDSLLVVHDEGSTQGERAGVAKSYGYYFYNCRNRLVFGSRFLSRAALLGWIVRTPYESWQILLRGGRRQLLSSRAPLKAILLGSLSGLRVAFAALARGNKQTVTIS